VRYGPPVSASGRTCRKQAGPSRAELEIEIEADFVRVRAGRRLVGTLIGADAARARALADDPERLDRFLASKMPR